MPILPAEPDFYPPDLWEDPQAIPRSHEEAVWWCLHAKPRQEKATGRELRKLGLTFYLPQVLKEDRTPQGRKIRSVIPLFPSYLFLHGDYNDRLAALRGNRLVAVLEVAIRPRWSAISGRSTRCSAPGSRSSPSRPSPVGSRVQDHHGAAHGDRGDGDPARQARPVRGGGPIPRAGGHRGSRGLAGRAGSGTVTGTATLMVATGLPAHRTDGGALATPTRKSTQGKPTSSRRNAASELAGSLSEPVRLPQALLRVIPVTRDPLVMDAGSLAGRGQPGRSHLKVVPANGRVQRQENPQIVSKGLPSPQFPEHGTGQGHVAFQVRVVRVLDHLVVEQPRGADAHQLGASIDQDAGGMSCRHLAIGVPEGGRAADRQPVVLERFAVVTAGLIDPVLALEQAGNPEMGLGKRRMPIEDLLVERQAQVGASGLGLSRLFKLLGPAGPAPLVWPWPGREDRLGSKPPSLAGGMIRIGKMPIRSQ